MDDHSESPSSAVAAKRARLRALLERKQAKRLPLSFGQQRLWFLHQLDPDGVQYNISGAVRIRGALQVDALEHSLNLVIRRHDALRAVFESVDGQPVQRLLPEVVLHLVPEPLSHASIADIARAEARVAFDLARGPLIRARLLRVAEREHVLVVTLHHLVSDGWSQAVLVHEITAFYDAAAAGQTPMLPPLPIQYADYARWQDERLASAALEPELAYWQHHLAGAPTDLALSTDRPRPATSQHRGVRCTFRIEPELGARIAAVGRREGATPFMTLLAVWHVLLMRSTGQDDIVVGTPVAGRNRLELEGLIGLFINTLALRTHGSLADSFRALLGKVRETTLAGYAHQEVPFEKVVERLAPERDLGRSPFFQTFFILQNAPGGPPSLSGLELALEVPDAGISLFDLMVTLEPEGEGFTGTLELDAELFDQATGEAWVARYLRLVEAAAAQPDAAIGDLAWLEAPETPETHDAHAAPELDVVTQLEAQRRHSPHAVAVRCAGQAWTYDELHRRADALADALRAHGVAADHVVGLVATRSLELVVGVLGILKAGAAYLPLDPSLPEARLRVMVTDARAHLIAAQPAHAPLAMALGPTLTIDVALEATSIPELASPAIRIAPAQAAYVLYVAGVTGRPNGVVNTHHGLANRLRWAKDALALSAADVVLHKAPLVSDVAIWELLWPLIAGAQLMIAPPGAHRDPGELAAIIAAEQVTVCHFVPTMLRAFLDVPAVEARARSLRQIVISGEPLARALVDRGHAALAAELHVLYGPTEAASDVTWWPCAPDDARPTIPLGRAIDHVELHVLDPELRAAPPGVPGELYIGGAALARGYLGPALTAERFVPSPFGPAGARLYRTGDAVRVLPDGSVEFLWRLDQQIKLRGVRLELAEIEAALHQVPSIAAAAVALHKNAEGDDALVAYVVWRDEPAWPAAQDQLLAVLPELMVPTAVVTMARLPRAAGGKLNRKALRPPTNGAHAGPAVREAPHAGLEQALAEIWKSLLGMAEISRRDHFFRIGGHSLLAVRAVSQISRTLDVKLTLAELFETPVLADLAARLDAQRGGDRLPPLIATGEGDAPLSFAQERLWVIDQAQLGDPSAYHVPVALRLRGPLDAARLAGALDAVVARHPALRTAIVDVDGAPVQRVAATAAVPFATRAAAPDELAAFLAREVQRPFALDQAPLLRALLVRLADDDHVCLITAHHLVTDGWSMTILVGDLQAAYAGQALATPPAARYADYARWQRELVTAGTLDDQLAFWRRTLANPPAALDLPFDHPAGKHPGLAGLAARRLAPALVDQLRALAVEQGGTLSMAVLAGFGALLHRICGLVSELRIGTAVAGRSLGALEPLVGLFVNTLVIPIELASRPSFRQLVGRTRATLVAAHAHAELPFDQLQRALRHDPPFQVFFDYHHLLPALRLGDVVAEAFPIEGQAAKLDLALEVEEEADGGLTLELEYDTTRFAPQTIARLAEQLERFLVGAAMAPDAPIGRHDLLGADRQALIVAPNQTANDWSQLDTFPRLFARQVELRGHAEAVRCDGQTLSYRALDARANRVAHGLIARGLGPESIVALLMDRSIGYLVTVLGVLKAGAAFLPLDPAWPQARLEVSLATARTQLLLSEARHAALAEAAGPAIPGVTLEELLATPASERDPERPVHPRSLAYVIFTSGSTGVPKGAMIEHRGMLNHLRAKVATLGMGAETMLAQTSTQTFDVSVWQLLAPLLCGGRVSIFRNDEAWEPQPLLAKLARDQVTIMETVPSHFTLMLDELEGGGRYDLSHLAWMFLNGEALLPQLCARWLALWPAAAISNSYGATECSDDTTQLPVRSAPDYPTRYVPIHGNLPNLTGYVLDADLEPVPAGIAGEMYIGGVGVGRGYLHDPARTAQAFVPDPFAAALGFGSGARMYKSGDKARVLADGTIEFLGRVDHQVKVRGHRIEIGEIESALAGHEQVREATVVATPSGNGTDARLIAYVVPRDRPWPLVAAIAEYLGLCLPDYMVPAHIVLLEALPLLDNGKVNRRALTERELDTARPGVALEAPVGPIETAIAEVWAELLETPVGRASNFFELGGHSLLAVQSTSRLRKRLGREVSVRDQFEARTVIELARRLAANAGSGASATSVFAAHPIERLPEREIYPLSAYQLPEWFIHELEPDLLVFSVSLADVMFVGDFDVDVFVAAWQALVDRHPIFRTTFATVDGKPVQRVRPRQLVRKEDVFVDRTALAEADVAPALRELTARWTNHNFDFETEPLFVVKLVALPANQFFFVFHTHHIVWDETSTMIMAREVAELYNAKLAGRQPRLGPAPLSYGDFSVWITRALAEGWLDDQRRYWLEQFREVPPPLELPTDFPRPPIQTFRGAIVEGRRGAALAQQITAFLAGRELTLNVFLHAVLNAALFKITGQRDFVVGTPFGNRADQELEGVLGLFATALPVRCTIERGTTFDELLASTQRVLMGALDHPLYPSVLAIQEINPTMDRSRGRLFSVMYGLQNDKRRLLDELRFTGAEIRPITFVQEAIEQSAPLELTWVFDHDEQGLFLRLDYNTDLFSAATAQRWVELFFDCAEQVIARPAMPVAELRALGGDARRVLEGFNVTPAVTAEVASVVELIAAQCARTPDALAVISSAGSWTYRELEQHANQLAHVLRAEGVGFETPVGVCLAPSRERVAAVLAILKAGASYVPVNPDEPEARQRQVRDAARLGHVLVDGRGMSPAGSAAEWGRGSIDGPADAPGALVFETLLQRAAQASREAPRLTIHPRQRAYVLFTSGSSGTPKGIAIEHAGIVNLVASTQQRYQLGARDALLALTPLSFDASVLDLFWTLAHGARLVVPSAGEQRSPQAIGGLIREHEVTLFQTVPALLAELVHARATGELPALPSLRQVICGGSALSRKLRDDALAAFGCALANHYGPTEVTVDASVFDARQPCAWSVVPIGAPVGNARIYVVDDGLEPVALGSVGEIVVSSPGLARGYLHDPARTAAAFVPDPFGLDPFGHGGRLYRTGDLGRHDADGVLHFVGRVDHQVKIHGHRVELEDVERQLAEHPAVVEVAVRPARDPDDGLVAYVELGEGYGRVVEGDQVLQLVTLAQRPELKPATDRVHQQAWPEYFAAGASLQTYWPRLATELPEFQYALLDASDAIVAVGNALPITWDGTVEDLPSGWDDGLARGFVGAAAGRAPDTFFILTGIVAESAQGRGLATAVLKAFKSVAQALGFARVVVAVRPTGKSAHPSLTFADYVALTRPDGLAEDAWVRTHQRVGGKILKIDPTSQHIRAGIADWQRWAGTTFPVSGDYPVKDCLQPVRIDLEAGVGEYFDPAVWIEHPPEAGAGYPFRHVEGAELRQFLRARLPEHMVPSAFRFVTRLPRTTAGKLDEQRLLATGSTTARADRFRPPATPIQHVLVEIWRAVLGGETIGVLDDFFTLGGHSIRAVQMLLRVTQRLGVEVTLKDFYRDPTILGLEKQLEQVIGQRGAVARKAAPAAAPSVGFGKARGHHGEILQGAFEVGERRLVRALVSLPCPVLYAEAIFTSDDTGVVRVEPAWKTKAARAAELMLAAAGAEHTGGHLELRSNIQVGWGLGSSTSDVVATLRAVAHAVRHEISEPALAALAVAAEQASDSIMFEHDAVLFGHRTGHVVEAFAQPLPALDVLGFNTSDDDRGTDTLATPRARYTAAELDSFAELHPLLRRAVASQDPRLLGQVATASARISQRYLAKPRFAQLAGLVESVGAVGLQVAHSGTVVGVLFDPRDDDREGRILRARTQILELGFRGIRRFRSS